jgi:hypothetical protein
MSIWLLYMCMMPNYIFYRHLCFVCDFHVKEKKSSLAAWRSPLAAVVSAEAAIPECAAAVTRRPT